MAVWGPGSSNNLVVGNYIGISAAGTASVGSASTQNGLHLSNAPLNTVGGTNAAARNIIGGLNLAGIALDGTNTFLNIIQGNYVGTDVTGTLDLGNNGDGVLVTGSASFNLIGGSGAGAGNLISGNDDTGIEINSVSATNNSILGNSIGVSSSGSALGNTSHGIHLFASRGNIIGGTNSGDGNLIAFNSGDGVNVVSGTHTNNTIRGNSFHSNGDLGIDLGGAGLTANDTGDADPGANLLQNFPVLYAATNSAAGTEIWGSLDSANSLTYSIDFYASFTNDGSGAGEGQFYLGSTNVTTDGSGNAGFMITLPIVSLPGRYISATATDPFGNTSEFATNVWAVSTVAGTTYTVTTTNDSGPGSLRDAIGLANTNVSSGDTIAFNIPGAGVQVISVASALPSITDSVTIDGTTQPGANCPTSSTNFDGAVLIRLQGPGLANTDGLRFSTGGNTVRGLQIVGFTGSNSDGIEFAGGSNNVVECSLIGITHTNTALANNVGLHLNASKGNRIGGTNAAQKNVISGNTTTGLRIAGPGATLNEVLGNFIGLQLSGATNRGNGGDGILLTAAASNTVGGASSAARNYISGNTSDGIEVNAATNNVILGNYIGTDVSGTLDLGNSADGILVTASSRGNVLGGAGSNEGNLISGNNAFGVELFTGTTTNSILGNIIGANVTGTNALGNTSHGVQINGGTNNTLGGVAAGEANILAFNAGDGVYVASGSNNIIRGNSIFSNTGLGIDLGTSDPTPNDAGDADTGANMLQNVPILTAAANTPTETTITGSLNGRASTSFLIDFYASAAADPLNSGEGQFYLGSTNVTTDGSGNGSFTAVLPVTTLLGRFISATATDPFGNTSEFATNVVASSTVAGSTFTVTTTADSGSGSLREAIQLANANISALDTIDFNIPGAGVQVIQPLTALPFVTDPVTIDGSTQPGASCPTSSTNFDGTVLIRLLGTGLPAGTDGLRFTLGGNTVRGLQILGFVGDGIEFTNGAGNVVECSLIGITDTSSAVANGNGINFNTSSGNRVGGTNAAQRNVISGNTTAGLVANGATSGSNEVLGNIIGLNLAGTTNRANGLGLNLNGAHNNIIGGTNAGARNLIGGNSSHGVQITTSATNNSVLGNYIGTDFSGTIDLGNVNAGVLINASASLNVVGGATPGAGNLISGNNGGGIQINSATSTNNVILGNWIGVKADGTNALANTGHGIALTAARGTTIGGTNSGAGNLIAFNTLDGVNNPTTSHTNNTIRGNSIYSNGDLGIDLAGAGITGNDAGDADAGANLSQNFPVLTAATNSLSGTEIWGALNSAGSLTYAIDFYANVAVDNTGMGEGQFYLGSTDVTTDGSGNASFVTTVPVATLSGRYITATATDPFGNTSEFGTNIFAVSTVAGTTNVVTTTADSGPGSLREAIQLANANVSAMDTIAFNIPGAGVQVIQPLTALPFVTDPVIIDGTTQPGASCPASSTNFDGTVLIRLVGTGLPAGTDGLRFTVGGNTVRGLQIGGFTGSNSDGLEFAGGRGNAVECSLIGITETGTALANNVGIHFSASGGNRVGGTNAAQKNIVSGNTASGIRIAGASSSFNEVLGNIIGLDLTGTVDVGNTDGILLTGTHSNTVGGASAGARNVISGNADGVQIESGASWNVVEGNYIGTDVGGSLDLGQSSVGVLISASAWNVIGGTAAGAGNVISGNNNDGVSVTGSGAISNSVLGNFIGTDASGTLALGNSGDGVEIGSSARDTTVGTVGGGNIIAHNAGDGVTVGNSTANTNHAIRANRIFSNGDLGIDLGAAGVAVNDPGDGDTGANRLQNFPLLVAVTNSLGGTEVWGTLNSAAGATFAIDVFVNDVCDTSGNGEGRFYLGSTNVTTDGSGNGSFIFQSPLTILPGRYFTATATDATGNSSEFSPCTFATSTVPGTTYTVVNTNDSGSGSLREAISQANTNISAGDTIGFNIPGAGVRVIRPLTALPNITDPVTIDGTTQPGAGCPTSSTIFDGTVLIRLDGAGWPADGLHFTVGDNTVRGLQVVDFDGDGIQFSGGSGSVLECSLIGIDELGADRGNFNGVHLNSTSSNRIGGTLAGAKNVISGNTTGVRASVGLPSGNLVLGNIIGLNLTGSAIVANSDGILLSAAHNNVIGGNAPGARNVISGNATGVQISAGATNNLVQGNYIGTDVTGTIDLGQTGDGVDISASSQNIIGGANAGEGNLISGNGGSGVDVISSGSLSNRIYGNFIGTDVSGESALGNGTYGVRINASVRDITIGVPGAGNLIAFNGLDGVGLANNSALTNITIRANRIHSNGDLGIDLGLNGVTANDAGDTDGNPNGLQNFPVLTAVTNTTTNTFIVGTLNSRASTTYTVDFYSSSAADVSGNGEGQFYLGSTNVTTDGSGNAGFAGEFAPVSGRYLSATATDPAGNTSEFSAWRPTVSLIAPSTFTVLNTNDSGAGSLRAAMLSNNLTVSASPNTIEFNIAGPGPHTLAPLTALPALTEPVIVDGFTQPGAVTNSLCAGFDGVLRIRLVGTSAPANSDGLVLAGFGGSVVRGLCLLGWGAGGGADGDAIELLSGTNHTVEGCFLGLDVDGSTALGNGFYGVHLTAGSSNSLIGGSAPWARNVISGNGVSGIRNLSSPGNVIAGNFIGTTASGTAGLGNLARGIDITGAAAVGNVIGGTNGCARNVIAANGQFTFSNHDGIYLDSSIQTRIAGNFIGTDVTGTVDLGNASSGVHLLGAKFTTVGGATAAARNIISGNFHGVELENTSLSNSVLGNFIGTDATGTLPLGNDSVAVILAGARFNQIGAVGAGNVLGGGDVGVYVAGNASPSNSIVANFIGTDTGATLNLGGAQTGVRIEQPRTYIGGTNAGEGNVIAHYAGAGLTVSSGDNGVAILGNSIHSNGSLGIDLYFNFGVTLNDPGDTDTGGNDLQNFPEVASATTDTNVVVAAGTLHSHSNQTFRLEFFASPVADPSGYGQGRTYLGATNVTTDAAGDVGWTAVLATALPAGGVITATATDTNGSTSEFSAAASLVPYDSVGLSVTITDSADPASIALGYSYSLIVTNSGPTNATGVVVSNALPAGVNFVSATASQGGCVHSNGVVLCTLGTLAATGNAFITIDVAATTTGSMENTATVTADQQDHTPADNMFTETTWTGVADLAVGASDAPDPVGAGQTLLYTVTVTNLGPDTATGVGVSESLDPTVYVLGVAVSQGTPTVAGSFVSADLGTILSGGTATMVITGIPTQVTLISDSASVGGLEADPDLGNNTAFGDTTVTNGAGVFEFTVTATTVFEGAGHAQVAVQRLGGALGTVTVDYHTLPGTATGGLDYSNTSGTLSFTNGQAWRFISVPILEDLATECNEAFSLLLSNATGGGGLYFNTNVELSIIDNDLPAPGAVRLVSRALAGVPAYGNGESERASISGDGRWTAFHSGANNLAANDGNSAYDIFVHDLLHGTNLLVSVNTNGTGGSASSEFARISRDGGVVAFQSYADDLAAGDNNFSFDVFARDLASHTTWLLSVNTNGLSGSDASYAASVSSNGSVVVFETLAHDLFPGGDGNFAADVYAWSSSDPLHPRLVSVNSAGTGPGNGTSSEPIVSANGRHVVFTSEADDLVPSDANGLGDVFLHDLVSSNTTLISANTNGDACASGAYGGLVSADGRYVVFASESGDLSVHGGNGWSQIYRRDTVLGTNELVTVATNGGLGSSASYLGGLSADGRHVIFSSFAGNLVPADNNGQQDVFVRDLTAGVTHLVSTTGGGSGSGNSQDGTVSDDGRYAAFITLADDLGATDGNFYYDVYLRDLVAGTTTLISRNADGSDSAAGESTWPAISAQGTAVAYQSWAADLLPGDAGSFTDAFAFSIAGGTNTLLSRGTGVTPPAGSYGIALSADGAWAAFDSDGGNLVTNDHNQYGDVFVRDLTNGMTRLVSVNLGGTAGNAQSFGGVISADGAWVAFASHADDLVAVDNNFSSDIFLHDLGSGLTTLVSLSTNGVDGGDGHSFNPRLSTDGRYVAFLSPAANLDFTPDGNFVDDVYLRDTWSNRTELISVNAAGTAAGHASTYDFTMTPDGRHFAMETVATNLTAVPDNNGTEDIVQRDRQTGTNRLISVNAAGTASANGYSYDPVMTPDGRYVLFTSSATDVVNNDTNGAADVFLRDTVLGTTTLVSVDLAGTGMGNDSSYGTSISDDGRYVAIESAASNLAANDSNGTQLDVFVRDLVAGTTTLISRDCPGTGSGNNYSYGGLLTPDGRHLVFYSAATDLLPGLFQPNMEQVYRHDRLSGDTVLLSRNTAAAGGGNRHSYSASLSSNARTVAFVSESSDLVADDANGLPDVFFWNADATTNCPPGIALQPQDRSASAGDTVSFSVTASACGADGYQWFFGAAPIAGGHTANLLLSGVTSCEAGGYSVVLSNASGMITSSVATLTITNNAPTLLSPGGALTTATRLECASLILPGGGAYHWNLSNAASAAGVGWDLVGVPGGVDVQATASNQFTIHLISLNGGAGGPAANFDPNATSIWNIVTSAAPVTNFSASAFAVNTTLFSNDLAGGTFAVEEGSLRLRFDPNHAPVANDVSMSRAANVSLKIPIASLLTNTLDPDGDVRALLSVSTTSTNGVPITLDSTNIYYPNATTNLADRLTYTVRDVRAAYRAGDTVRTASAFIDITIAEPAGTNFNIVSINYTSGIPTIVFAGIPGYAYDVQRTTNLTPPAVWTTLWTTNAPTNGLFHFTDAAPPTNSAFYRSAQP